MVSIHDQSLQSYSFIDLFAGIGGFHLALNSIGANCIFASEWDRFAASTYLNNFDLKPFGDITKIKEDVIPSHEILCAGFPCQAFSISGKQKGFDDVRGTLFFDIARIANFHKPKVLFLENVKNLVKHDEGKTFQIIQKTLDELGYTYFYEVLNSGQFGLPQNRERIYIVAFRKDLNITEFIFPKPNQKAVSLEMFLEDNPSNAKVINRHDIEIYKNFTLENSIFDEVILPNKPIQIGKVNKGGQGERIYHPIGHAITLSAHGGGVGSKTGLYLVDGKIRKLSPRECARIQGFPDDFILNESDSQTYKQFGNSVSVNVLQQIAIEIGNTLNLQQKPNSTLLQNNVAI